MEDNRAGERKGEAETKEMKSDGRMDGFMHSRASEVKTHLFYPLTTESSEPGSRDVCTHHELLRYDY